MHKLVAATTAATTLQSTVIGKVL